MDAIGVVAGAGIEVSGVKYRQINSREQDRDRSGRPRFLAAIGDVRKSDSLVCFIAC
jgi:hypothetical protein